NAPEHQQRRSRPAEPTPQDRPALDGLPQHLQPEGLHRVEERLHWITFGAPANVRAMAIKLRDLKNEARTLARAKQYAAALAAHDHMLAINPLDNDSRRKIADLLLALGDRASGAQVTRVVAMHDARSGHLLPAIVGCKVLESLGERSDEIVSVLAA